MEELDRVEDLEAKGDRRVLGSHDPVYGGVMYRVSKHQHAVSPIVDSSISSEEWPEPKNTIARDMSKIDM